MPYGKSDYRIIDVTPTLDTSEYASGDALFNRAEIPAAVWRVLMTLWILQQ